MKRINNQSGFTIIELLLAMAFISVLLVGVAVTVIQISSIYNKGLTMKSVDQVGRDVSTDIRATLAQSQPFSVEANSSSSGLREIPRQDQNGSGGGRLCTGTYTYVWNYGSAIVSGNSVNKYSSSDDEIRFARVHDNGGQYCADPTKAIEKHDATELLSAGDKDLAIQSFSIKQLANDSNLSQALYRVVIEIGTNNQDALQQKQSLDTMDTTCKPPNDDSSLQDYCAVNQFDFTATAGNRGGAS